MRTAQLKSMTRPPDAAESLSCTMSVKVRKSVKHHLENPRFRIFSGPTAEIQDPAIRRFRVTDRYRVCEGPKISKVQAGNTSSSKIRPIFRLFAGRTAEIQDPATRRHRVAVMHHVCGQQSVKVQKSVKSKLEIPAVPKSGRLFGYFRTAHSRNSRPGHQTPPSS